MPVISWIKNNKLSAFLILVLLYFVILKPLTTSLFGVRMSSRSYDGALSAPQSAKMNVSLGMAAPEMMDSSSMPVPVDDAAPQAGGSRMVISESNLSLLVKSVVEARDRILKLATANGGYMVDSSTQSPTEAPTATVTIRVASDKLETVLSELRGLSIKVVSENLHGYDVTDQYTDIEKRIAIYQATKTRYEAIMAQATEISDITNLTTQIVSTQAQIDSLKGRQEYLKQNAELAKVTIYLSTDEIALPYAPSDAWRPQVVFKMAVRSLVTDLRSLADNLIWIGVYAVIWLPLALLGYLGWRVFRKKPLH